MRTMCAALTVLLLTTLLALPGITNYSRPSGARALLNLCTFLTMAAPAYADTIHVKSGDCLQDSIDAADAGDVVLVHPGTYAENIVLTSKHNQITIQSTAGPDSTVINGGTATRAVLCDSVEECAFAGFTIRGGTDYGLCAMKCDHSSVSDLVFDSDADLAVLRDLGGGEDMFYEGISMNGPSDASSGLEVASSDGYFLDVSVVGIHEGKGVYAWGGEAPHLTRLVVDSCEIGLAVAKLTAHPDTVTISNCTVGVEVHPPEDEHTTLILIAAAVSACTTGVVAQADSAADIDLWIDGSSINECETGLETATSKAGQRGTIALTFDYTTVSGCADGLVLSGTNGLIRGSAFLNIEDTGICMESLDTLTIGDVGVPSDLNLLGGIDGAGILVGPSSVATIGGNECDTIWGTAIQVESGTDGTCISDCDIDGTHDCYEGIATTKAGTWVEVRDCLVYDFDTHMSPEPRGASVNGPTACLGTAVDAGNNSFEDNALDLCYNNRDATPDSLQAKYNWWGETEPDTSQFCGRKEYIAYHPHLTSKAKLLPVTDEPTGAPSIPTLTSAFPNPASGAAELRYWMPVTGRVRISVYDLGGRLVRNLLDREVSAGFGSVTWDGRDGSDGVCSSGAYVVRLTSPVGTDTGRFVLER